MVETYFKLWIKIYSSFLIWVPIHVSPHTYNTDNKVLVWKTMMSDSFFHNIFVFKVIHWVNYVIIYS